jgi:OmpA-OmpF porin, OOP family
MHRMTWRLIAAASIAATATLAACSSPAHDPASNPPPAVVRARCAPVVDVVSGRMNSPAPGLTTAMHAAAGRAVRRSAPIGLVNLDGSPQLVALSKFSDPGANPAALAQAQQAFLSSFASAVAHTRAARPHADVLDALEVAGRAIHGECASGTMYLEDSGLQETGPLNFRQPGLLSADPADVVRFLRREHELPDLSGITVVLTGIGDTAPPQLPLSIAQRASLTAIWSAIATAAGAASVQASSTPRAGISAPAHVPPVLLVPVPPESPWTPSRVNYRFPDSGAVGFMPNTTAFRAPSAVSAALRPIARYLIANRTAKIELTGTTAHWGSFGASLTLSRQRAEAVKAVLVSMGAYPGQITTRGLGWRFPGYQNDQGPGGTLLPGPAEHNRSVVVTTG